MKHILMSISCALLFGFTRVPATHATEGISDATATLAMHHISPDTRATKLHAYLESHNSPLASESGHFIAEADRLGLDWRLVAAIAGVESTYGKQIPNGSYNAWGWGIPTGATWGIAFGDWKGGITTVSEGLKYNYIDKGAVTINQMGRMYAASPAWSWKVRYFIDQITEFMPNSPSLLSVTI
ncbi:hypothetical protein A2875_04175 [Candidatus Gottesmanbacteria bacterium RIFCSPHIGHO2_01_FULL_46_14]|uniref:Mannosyl-glycoprotein endo-beta-N-acetylglucosamidase-like domain-containing protein n=3 Tax=Microgenomates group TaxID=1794810 RepID=A0A1F5ZSY6_9BACT|nr:MAG: hypothetical protein A2875_04175 [Candidatus Gottesmanbacteria bacterium RIFCSPHIGHO2_01_FULL_46_14]OGG30208.1 MAG: hypothetical protein A2971_04120 [Candidatus Gottesmanbacteria bacterium RIFCSPLOWO2_01_FULL_46_21]HCR81422.1 hypothetical protein [Candidatus Paceibacterota bacterium]